MGVLDNNQVIQSFIEGKESSNFALRSDKNALRYKHKTLAIKKSDGTIVVNMLKTNDVLEELFRVLIQEFVPKDRILFDYNGSFFKL